MATNIDKGVYAPPQGLELLADELDMPEIEIEIEDPESVSIGMDGLEVKIDPDAEEDNSFDENLADVIPDDVLSSISSDLLDDYQSDEDSRKDWLDTYVEGIELLGLKVEEKTEPWPGACSVYHPLLTEALVKFQSETMMETFPAAGPVKTQIIGKQTPEKDQAALRVREDMNYQLTEAMPEYRPEHERMLWGLGLSGNAFKKVYYDPTLERQSSIFITAEDIVVPYGASDLQTASRVTHIMRKTKNELRKLQVAGFYRDIELGEPAHSVEEVEKKIAEKMGFNATMDDRYKLLEMHVDIDMFSYNFKEEFAEDNGIALPYVVTLERGTGEILSIRRNWNPDDNTNQKRQHFVHYGYVPGFGFYCFGLVHLIGAATKSATMLTRQLVDAGTLSNLPGGFKTRGLRVKGDDTPIAPAEFRDVDVPSGTIRDNIMALPYKEPSQVLQSLMNQIIQEGKAFANAADMQVSDMSANSPVGTTLAILERTLKVMSAVQARIHYSMRQEFKLLKSIIRDYTDDDYAYEPDSGRAQAKRADYDMVEVIPVSDPNAATMSQKVVQYQAVMQMAQQSPQIYDLPELHKQMLEVLGIKNIGKLIPATGENKPKDPVSENMAILTGKPVKAFLFQDHQAHIEVHMAAMQDPLIQKMVGQNPQAQAMMAAAQAHIAEHVGFEYRKQIEEKLGVPLPHPEDTLPEDIEVDISRLVSQAAQQVLATNQQKAAQEQAQQQAQDPLIQMQQQELQLKAQDVQNKGQKIQIDAQLEQERLQVERERIASQERIAGAQLGAKAAMDKEKLDAQQLAEGTRIGIQAVQQSAQRDVERERIAQQDRAANAQAKAQEANRNTQQPTEEGE
jgi:hypothetical protein